MITFIVFKNLHFETYFLSLHFQVPKMQLSYKRMAKIVLCKWPLICNRQWCLFETVVTLWLSGECTNPDGLKSAYSCGCPWFTILPACLGTGMWKYYVTVTRFCETECFFFLRQCQGCLSDGLRCPTVAVVIAYCDAAVECAEKKYNRCNWLHSVACGEWIDLSTESTFTPSICTKSLVYKIARKVW